jgi:hypothetical protein
MLFANDSVALMQLLMDSKEGFCFVETTTNDKIPFKDCELVEMGETHLKGKDFINNIVNRIPISKITGTTTVGTADNILIKKETDNFLKIKEMCSAENITINASLFYKNVSIHQKIISMLLNKPYEEISLDDLKELWKKHINAYCNTFEKHIESELKEDTNDLYKTELQQILVELRVIKSFEEVNMTEDKQQLLSFWPTLLMPSPCFVAPSS